MIPSRRCIKSPLFHVVVPIDKCQTSFNIIMVKFCLNHVSTHTRKTYLSSQFSIFTKINIDYSRTIQPMLLCIQKLFVVSHGPQKTPIIDKRKKNLSQPSKFLTCKIYLELTWKIICNGRVRIGHKMSDMSWKC